MELQLQLQPEEEEASVRARHSGICSRAGRRGIMQTGSGSWTRDISSRGCCWISRGIRGPGRGLYNLGDSYLEGVESVGIDSCMLGIHLYRLYLHSLAVLIVLIVLVVLVVLVVLIVCLVE